MKCWNCNRKLPTGAKVCSFCEAPVEEEPPAEAIEAVRELLNQMPPDLMTELQRAVAESETAEEFADRIFVGDCPKCGSDDTGNCENDPEINDLLVGRCYECGQLFCTECGKLLEPKAATCECLDEELEP